MVSTNGSQSAKLPTKEDETEKMIKEDGNSIEQVEEDGDGDSDSDSDGDDSEHAGVVQDENEENVKLRATPSKKKTSLFLNSDKKKNRNEKNALTHLIPGYTARMRLESSSLDKYKCGIRELGRRAERTMHPPETLSSKQLPKKSTTT